MYCRIPLHTLSDWTAVSINISNSRRYNTLMNKWIVRSGQRLVSTNKLYRLWPEIRRFSTTEFGCPWFNLAPHQVSRYIIYHLCQRAGCGGKGFQLVEQTSSSGRSPPTMIRGAIPRPQIGGCFTPDSGTSAPGRHEEARSNSLPRVVNKHSLNSSGIAQTQLKNHTDCSVRDSRHGARRKGRTSTRWEE